MDIFKTFSFLKNPAIAEGLQQRCFSQQVLQAQLAADPTLAARMENIERLTASYVENPPSSFRAGDDIVIPVWVNVLYNNNAENISDNQIASQIQVLNEDFAASNNDYRKVPDLFAPVKSGDTHIRFILSGITRKATSVTEWSYSGGEPLKKSLKGGIDPTSPTTTLNIWSADLGDYILGYAQFPGGNLATDGVVLDDNAFGKRYSTIAPYNLGRTATHEVGHWLNLRHIWGDRRCGNDHVADTPEAEAYNFGCPKFPTYGSCSATIPMMTMNYMDYTVDACMYFFTAGQNARMQATFLGGGGRESFAQ